MSFELSCEILVLIVSVAHGLQTFSPDLVLIACVAHEL